MSNSMVILYFSITLLFLAYMYPNLSQPKQTNLVFYVHDYLGGKQITGVTVAGKSGPTSDILQFGTMVVVDDAVTEGPSIESKEIGRAQGLYINSQLDGKAIYLVFSIVFTEGEFKGSTLEIQGADPFTVKEREFSIVSGTGYFRFVKGYGIMTTESLDIPNLSAILKLNSSFGFWVEARDRQGLGSSALIDSSVALRGFGPSAVLNQASGIARNLSLVYTLAGVHCIDCAADDSVVSAVNEGIDAAMEIVRLQFDASDCPLDLSRPCENVCPANAITLKEDNFTTKFPLGGVITERCYGCGRCFPFCPYDKIRAITYVRDVISTAKLMKRNDVDAIEIHTSGRQASLFEKLWNGLAGSVRYLKLVAISLPDVGGSTVAEMNTVDALIGGVAYSGYARMVCSFSAILSPQTLACNNIKFLFQIVGRVLAAMQSQCGLAHIEDYPDYLIEALREALKLVGTFQMLWTVDPLEHTIL
ncbi:4Fe-4S ferredoxin-type, iron-sulfur binding domain [Dillenia turbinata]|uniref:Dirigent protein n=1 Tax=Dillenia turbinata TaxID=194707 RepID=A0AAN8UB34_9MAGN